MIRITAHQKPKATWLLLEGKLAGDSVAELEKCWRVASTAKNSVSIDLTSVSFIDSRGKQLLLKMFESGARLVSKGLLARCIIEEIKEEFVTWMKGRKFAPAINALKEKLNAIKVSELDFQSKKIADFNEAQAEIISNRIIQKITTHFANHLKDDDTMVDESIEWIEKVFKIKAS